MAAKLAVVARFLVALLGNLLADVAQIESLLGTVGTVVGLIVASGGGNPQVVRIGGLVTSALSILAVALPKVIAVGKQAESDLETLLGHASAAKPPAAG